MQNIYGYARKSPDPGRRKEHEAEDIKATSVEQQQADIEIEAAIYRAEHPEYTYIKTYADDDVSAQRQNGIPWDRRPELQALLRQAERGDVIIVDALDRLERGGPARMLAVAEYIERLGITLIPLKPIERFIMSLPATMREFMLSLSGLQAAMQSEEVSRRTQRNHRQMVAKGCRITAHPPYGYRWKKVEGQTRRGEPRRVMVPNRELCHILVYEIWLPVKRNPAQRRTIYRRISRDLDRRRIELRPGLRWVQRQSNGRVRYQLARRVVQAIDKAVAAGQAEWGTVPIPKLNGKPTAIIKEAEE